MKQKISLALAICLMVMAFAGCSAGSNTADSSAAVEYEMSSGFAMQETGAPMAPAAGEQMAQDNLDGQASVQPRKQVQYVDLSLETLDFDTALQQLQQLVEDAGGYVENQQISGQSMASSSRYQERYATISARIPAQRLQEVVTSAGQLCNVTSSSQRMADITDSYYDAQARLENMQLQEERLRELLAQAQQLTDIIALEGQLTQVRSQIESLTAQLQRMDGQVAYSYLELRLSEVSQLRLIENAPKTLGEKIRAAFGRSGENIAQALEDILLFAIADLPTLLIYITLWLGVFWVVRMIWRRLFGDQAFQEWRKKRQQRRLQQQQPPKQDHP